MELRELMERTKESIAKDPNFDMSTYERCIAHHICKASGDVLVGKYTADGTHVAKAAQQHMGAAPGYLYCSNIRTKAAAYNRIDWFVEQHSHDHDRELVGA